MVIGRSDMVGNSYTHTSEAFKLYWEEDLETGTLAWLASSCDRSAMIGHHLFTDSQANACPLKFVPSMQALENLKNAVQIFFIKTDAIVLHFDLMVYFRIADRLH